MVQRVWGEGYRTTMVCIDSFEKGVPRGRFFNPYMETQQSFESLTQFLQGMEAVLDSMEFPKAFQAVRTFAPLPSGGAPPGEEVGQTGKRATFAIRILFRQNASGQGSVTWLEGKSEQSFRSALELILLMSTALECPQAS